MKEQKLTNNKAFTLIELIVVMAIIAILVLLAAPRFLGYTKDANVTAMQQDVKVLTDAAELYHIDYDNWPVKDEAITDHGIGGVDELYPIDESKLEDSVKNTKGVYGEYGLVISGVHKGKVFHVSGIEGSNGYKQYGNTFSENQPIRFDGKNYADAREVPESPSSWFEYETSNDGLIVSGFSDLYDSKTEKPKHISIPSHHKGKPIVAIGYSSFRNQNLVSVVLPETLKQIYSRAFKSNNIKNLHIPSSVTYVSVRSFNNNKLANDDAFIYRRNSDGSLNKEVIVSYGGADKNVVIPEGVRILDADSFTYSGIKSVTFPSTLKEIKERAFKVNSIESLDIPNNITSIKREAFNGNHIKNEEAIIYARKQDGSTDKTTVVSYGGLGGDIVIPANVIHISNWAFGYGNIRSVTVPKTVESIGANAFKYNNIHTINLHLNTIYSIDSFDDRVAINVIS